MKHLLVIGFTLPLLAQQPATFKGFKLGGTQAEAKTIEELDCKVNRVHASLASCRQPMPDLSPSKVRSGGLKSSAWDIGGAFVIPSFEFIDDSLVDLSRLTWILPIRFVRYTQRRLRNQVWEAVVGPQVASTERIGKHIYERGGHLENRVHRGANHEVQWLDQRRRVRCLSFGSLRKAPKGIGRDEKEGSRRTLADLHMRIVNYS